MGAAALSDESRHLTSSSTLLVVRQHCMCACVFAIPTLQIKSVDVSLAHGVAEPAPLSSSPNCGMHNPLLNVLIPNACCSWEPD